MQKGILISPLDKAYANENIQSNLSLRVLIIQEVFLYWTLDMKAF